MPETGGDRSRRGWCALIAEVAERAEAVAHTFRRGPFPIEAQRRVERAILEAFGRQRFFPLKPGAFPERLAGLDAEGLFYRAVEAVRPSLIRRHTPWAAGSLGSFPTYALGDVMAADLEASPPRPARLRRAPQPLIRYLRHKLAEIHGLPS